MSFDTLLTILFVVVFIVLPLASRALRRRSPPPSVPSRPPRSPQQPPRAGPAAPDEGAAGDMPPWLAEAQRRVREAQGRGAAEASTAAPQVDRQGQGTLVPEDPFGGLGRSGRGEAPAPYAPPAAPDWAPPAQRSLVPEDPFEKGLAEGSGGPQARPLLGREGAPRASDVPPSSEPGWQPPGALRAPEGGRRRRERAAVLVVTGADAAAYGRPPREGVGARLGVVGLLRFERGAIVRGLIWHEILDEPAWKRRRGRPLLPPR